MKQFSIIAATCALTLGSAQAATNGILGTSSTGTQNVSVVIQDPADNRVRVSGIFDVNLGTINPGRPASAFTNYCFYHTSPTFSLTVQQGDASSTDFALTNPNGDSVPLKLSLSLFDSSIFTTYEPQNGVTRTGLASNRSSETCNFGSFASGTYSLSSAVDQAPGTYTGTLTFVMAVE